MGAYCCSDFHGCYNQWVKIKNSLKDDDILFILGDCIDRKSDGFAILKEAYEDPRVILLCGNHEDMMMQALQEEQEYDSFDYWGYIWFNNGGHITYSEWQEDGRDYSWIDRINRLPTSAEYTNSKGIKYLLSHSGVTPKWPAPIDQLPRNLLIWDRDHLRERRWHRSEDEYAIFGHTPVQCMDRYCNCEDKPAPLIFCDGHKINIDNGAVWDGQICLFNLETGSYELIDGE